MGTLFVVATPIGNLEDVTLRALRLLRETPLVVAEDTRTIRKLLSRHNIPAPRLLSYTEHNHRERTPQVLAALDRGDVVLVSEAGMPGISDPGVHLVTAAAAAGYQVSPVPGASALTAALAAAGLPTVRVRYLGFLPRAGGERRRLLRELAGEADTVVFFEAPRRLRKTLGDLLEALGDRRVAVCRELTKLYEEIFRGSLSEALDHFSAPRGEFTIVIEGAPKPAARAKPVDIDAELRRLRAGGARPNEAVREVTERSGRPRSEVYRRWLALSAKE